MDIVRPKISGSHFRRGSLTALRTYMIDIFTGKSLGTGLCELELDDL
jgi:hypothetical protein